MSIKKTISCKSARGTEPDSTSCVKRYVSVFFPLILEISFEERNLQKNKGSTKSNIRGNKKGENNGEKTKCTEKESHIIPMKYEYQLQLLRELPLCRPIMTRSVTTHVRE